MNVDMGVCRPEADAGDPREHPIIEYLAAGMLSCMGDVETISGGEG